MRIRKILASLILLSSTACTSFPDSTRELWKRSGYMDDSKPQQSVSLERKIQRHEKVYLGKRILPSGDIFENGSILILMDKIN